MRSGPVRLVIFGQGRTGSTLLESLLCSTGYFHPKGELLNTSKGEILYPTQFIRGLSKRRSNENFIFHVKIYQLTRDRKRPIDPTSFLETPYREGWKVLYLRRKNKIRHALSNIVAKHRGSYPKNDDDKEKFKMLVNCQNFVERVEARLSLCMSWCGHWQICATSDKAHLPLWSVSGIAVKCSGLLDQT